MDGAQDYVILKRHYQAIPVLLGRRSSKSGHSPEVKLDISVQTAYPELTSFERPQKNSILNMSSPL